MKLTFSKFSLFDIFLGSALMDEQEALSFLHFRSRRSATDSSGDNGPTDIVEECCIEGCAFEEILEYC